MLTLLGDFMPKMPFDRLKALRKRAEYDTAEEVRRLLGYGSASAYAKYENGERGEKGIPNKVCRNLARVFVGRGTPPISLDEVMELEVEGPTKGYTPATPNSGYSAGLHFSATTQSSDQLLPIRANAEKGKFVEDNVRTQDAGPGSISPMQGGYLSVDAQFIVDVRDRHAEGLGYPSGTQLHCCWPEQFTQSASLDGKRIVVWRPRKDRSGLGENLVAAFKKEGKNGEWVGTDGEGQEVRGRPVAVVLQSLRPE